LFSIAKSIDFTLKIFEICYGGDVDTFLAHTPKIVVSRLPAPYVQRFSYASNEGTLQRSI